MNEGGEREDSNVIAHQSEAQALARLTPRQPITRTIHVPPIWAVYAVMWIPVLAYGAVLTMPAFLVVLGKHYGMSSKELGTLASAEWLVCITGTYLTNNRSIRELSRWVLWACGVAILVNLGGLYLAGTEGLLYVHPISTFGAGVAYGYALKIFHASRRQQHNYGVFIAVVNFSELAIFQLLNYLTNTVNKSAVFVVYAVLATGAVLIALAVRRSLDQSNGVSDDAPTRGSGKVRPLVMLSVIALGIAYTGFGMIWPFVQLMGAARGLSTLQVTNGASAYSITGILGALSAAALTTRINRPAIITLSLAVFLCSAYLLYVAQGSLWFIAGCAMFGYFWTFYCTSHVSLISESDTTGRAIVFCGIAPSVGAIAGSFWGGRLVQGDDYLPTGEVGSVIVIVGIGITVLTLLRKMTHRVRAAA